ncbi:MAG: transrane sensor, partial [Verrucomicrobiota bacterium]|nr:transrane sensor [Verrucomicrobiota bacterium]
WKDKTRPFIVQAGGMEVRAVGTAFNVRLEAHQLEVLVTEGVVKVEHPDGSAEELPPLQMGKRAVLALQPGLQFPVEVDSVTQEEIKRDLAWQAPRLQFQETPLADAVAEFNRLNRHQLVIVDLELGDRLIGGTFRPDNVEAFVRLLTETLGVRAEKTDDGRTLLRR